jgi:hypothetical protein
MWSVHGSEVLTPGILEIFVSTPKKRRLDPIDSSIGTHQDEENSVFIDLIDPGSDYLPDQLRFFLNQLRLRWKNTIDRARIFSVLWRRLDRSKYICVNSVTPNLDLKDSHGIEAFSSCPNFSIPWSSIRDLIPFLFFLIVAVGWKNFVLSSPRVAHLILPFCFQYTLCYSSRFARCSWIIFLKFHSSSDKYLVSSNISRKRAPPCYYWL